MEKKGDDRGGGGAVVDNATSEKGSTSGVRIGGTVSRPQLLTCLVTPKLTFTIPRAAEWQTARDVPQGVLRDGLATRLPIGAGLTTLRFEAVGRGSLEDVAIFKLSSDDESDERVLLSLLRAIERAYESKHAAALDLARTDMLSSSMTFQVMADEIRLRHDALSAKHEKETRGVKEHLQLTSKRLFLLEQEKEQLATQSRAADQSNHALVRRVDGLALENNELKSRTEALEQQLATLLELTADRAARHLHDAPPPPPQHAHSQNESAATQTELLVHSATFHTVTPRQRAQTKKHAQAPPAAEKRASPASAAQHPQPARPIK